MMTYGVTIVSALTITATAARCALDADLQTAFSTRGAAGEQPT